jgi:hypothetical protein
MAELTMTEASQKTHQWTGQEIAPVSLRAAAQRGALKAKKKGKDWVTTEANLRAYLNARPAHFRQAARSDTIEKGVRRIHVQGARSRKKVKPR